MQRIADAVLVLVASMLPAAVLALVASKRRQARSAGLAVIIYGTVFVLCLGFLRGCQ